VPCSSILHSCYTLCLLMISRHLFLFLFFFLMIRRPPRSTLFPYTSSSDLPEPYAADQIAGEADEPGIAIGIGRAGLACGLDAFEDRKSTRLNSSHVEISYAVFCLKKKKKQKHRLR